MEYSYFNRELSYLKFEKRILDESKDRENPLFERLKFLSIFSSNLDEFFEVRIGTLKSRVPLGKTAADSKTWLTPKRQIISCEGAVRELILEKADVYSEINKELKETAPYIGKLKTLGAKSRKTLKDYFLNEILPILSPQIIDSKHPLGHIDNKRLYIGLSLKSKKGRVFGIIAMPNNIPRLFHVRGTSCFILLEDIILKFSDLLFEGYKIRNKTIFRVTRSASIDINSFNDFDDYRLFISEKIVSRTALSPVRLEVSSLKDDELIAFLLKKLLLKKNDLFFCDCPLDFSFVSELSQKLEPSLKEKLIFKKFRPRNVIAQDCSVVDAILKKDLLISCPYESIRPLIDLLSEAARDKKTQSIKITLYRLSSQSQIVSNLCLAAENGIDVTVIIELCARFDEENNLAWSALLEDSGVHIFYGTQKLKVHSKVMLITRKTDDGYSYITHIGTGNYNEVTSRLYCDLSLITANRTIGEDAAEFFRSLTLCETEKNYKALLVSPYSLKRGFLELIKAEEDKALQGGKGIITAKMNSLTDKEIIDAFYHASSCGVKINLIIRGICCLKPGVKNLSENIRVISVVGRFLEHSRIYCFGKGESAKVYIASADMMTRSTERRVETAAPIFDRDISFKIQKMLEIMLADNVKARELESNGKYVKVKPKEKETPLDCQDFFIKNPL